MKRALVSVSNKEGIVPFCQSLNDLGIEIISTGGTKKILEGAKIPVESITKVTQNPEAFGGRVKTLSFQVASALLFRRENKSDRDDARSLGIDPIDLVICNLYPFEQAVCDGKDNLDDLIESIDIGGSTMIRAAAKNFYSVGIVTSPNQYDELEKELREEKTLSLETRRRLSLAAFKLSARYDTLVSEHLSQIERVDESEEFVKPIFSYHSNPTHLRYGENPQQRATLYHSFQKGIAHAEKIQGKELSYNNLLDAEAAWKSAGDVGRIDSSLATVSIVKHMNPCSLACHENVETALEWAWAADPTSSFGGVVATTSVLDKYFADFFEKKFIEVIIAPGITDEARAKFAHKKNLRILIYQNYSGHKEIVMRSLSGGLLVQDEDHSLDEDFNIVTKNKNIQRDYLLCQFTTSIVKYLKSNAIVIAMSREGGGMMLVGAGMGQPNRIDSFRKLAWPKAKEMIFLDKEKCIVGSDAFFPFPDMIQACHEMGVKNIIQPGGSVRDQEVIDEANRYDISMAFTAKRHFRH